MWIIPGTPPLKKWGGIDQLLEHEVEFLNEVVIQEVVAPSMLPSKDGSFSVPERLKPEASSELVSQ